MPGYNQRGPMNEGPMTGRKRGVCTQDQNSDQTGGMGYGMGHRRGNRARGCQQAGRGMGLGQRDLQNRADMLEAELEAIKNQIRNLSDS